MQYTLASYEQLALGYLAVLRKEDGALIGRCGWFKGNGAKLRAMMGA